MKISPGIVNKIMENVKAPRLPRKKNRLNLAMSEAIGPAKTIYKDGFELNIKVDQRLDEIAWQ